MKKVVARGFLSIEVALVILVLLGLMGVGATWLVKSGDTKRNENAAFHATTVKNSFTKFVNENRATVLAAAAPLAVYATADFASYLPSGFSVTNIYGQSYSVRVYKASPSKLETMIVTTGGQVISDGNLRQIAQAIGGSGGFVLSTNTASARGAFDGWSMPFTNFGASPGAGKIAIGLFYEDSMDVGGDYLHRNAVAGRPELNRMNTAIDMNNNSIVNVEQLNGANMTLTGTAAAGKLQINDVVTEGAACTPDGLMARKTSGMPLSCQSGVWATVGGSETPGQYAYFGTTTCPSGWVHADGLNGTVDLRGEFIRGWDAGRGVDAARTVRSFQDGALESHNHTVGIQRGSTSGSATTGIAYHGSLSATRTTYTSSSTGSAETRPRNVALLSCMKE